jgi:hypothetical protein
LDGHGDFRSGRVAKAALGFQFFPFLPSGDNPVLTPDPPVDWDFVAINLRKNPLLPV